MLRSFNCEWINRNSESSTNWYKQHSFINTVDGGDLMSESKSIFKYLGLISMVIGLIFAMLGFNESINVTWASTSLAIALTELLFGIALIALGNGLVLLAKT